MVLRRRVGWDAAAAAARLGQLAAAVAIKEYNHCGLHGLPSNVLPEGVLQCPRLMEPEESCPEPAVWGSHVAVSDAGCCLGPE